ncbi:ATP-binding cassette sub-family E member 1 [Cryptosporidium sp. chipmunk genotype I]|uniref:ATP-binding cassette sub-family E member 1 n=1 Tax=Cryptosporidium sp. chipmunk genotype I TaxID=1280935 RepID=UPI00351A8EC2|nr:ATP-binding cassette sub-family E member 1 [Cryptosporidium sp. chipmunk genotype I]
MPPKKSTKSAGGDENETRLRIAIVEADRCKPKNCRQECKSFCPVVRTGKLCVEVDSSSKIASISEPLCIGCGICVKKCPYSAITIINLPKNMSKDTTHRYGKNSFKLHRLPVPRPGQVLGLVGTNGIGKSTALQILSGKLRPNLGEYTKELEWKEVIAHFRGSELQTYFNKMQNGELKTVIKPQYVDHIPKRVKGRVGDIICAKDEKSIAETLIDELELRHLLDRQVGELSGGELQRFALCVSTSVAAMVYMYDEPSSYLDIKQRINAAKVIRNVLNHENYVIVVEHDLSVLDYLSDLICCLWGSPGVYGVVTTPFSVREGINIFLDGFVPTENMRFREEGLNFKIVDQDEIAMQRSNFVKYPGFTKTMGSFKLSAEAGDFGNSEIIVMLGQNGCGKTTFIKILAGVSKPDDSDVIDKDHYQMPEFNVSYKPQTISPKFEGSVRDLFLMKIRDSFMDVQFTSEVVKPFNIERIADQQVKLLSGGELQRVALILALGKKADIYLIDEPSAYLDSEQRITASKIIKRFILHSQKTAFVVEHDFIMATYLADRVILFTGTPGIDCCANRPENLVTGMNKFLKILEISFRRDPMNFRPRINKLDSVKDKEQKMSGNYFLLEE